MERPANTGLFGKHPAAPEFIRVRSGDALARELVQWLEEGSEAAARAKASLGAEPVRFVFSPPDSPRALVGAVVGSSDQVGRRFPLAVFSAADGSVLGQSFAALPRAARPFLDSAESLLADARELTTPQLTARIESLSPWDEGALQGELASGRSAASTTSAREALVRLCGDLDAGQPWYALHCFLTACRPLRGRQGAGAGVVLDCPARDEADRFTWLELALRLLRWPRPPSFFWAERPSGRLFVALGAPPAALLRALWQPSCPGGKIWPLTTEKPQAIAAARQALGASVRALVESHEASLAELFQKLETLDA